MPAPGEDLISRVAGTSDLDWFYRSGRESVRELERALAVADRSLDSFESVLDFGCGCGRMMLWMEDLGRTRALHGADIDAEAIAWCREHIPYAKFTCNGGDPPLHFADGAFDLIVNHSVFTHIDERRQDLWLTELRRVTRVGGLLLLSVHGETALGDSSSPAGERLEDEGILFVDGSQPPEFPLPDWYQNTYHAPWYVFEHWGRWFKVRALLPGAALGLQDHVLLERVPDQEVRAPILARPRRARTGAQAKNAAMLLAAAQASRESAAVAQSRFGSAGLFARRLARRAMRPYSAHQDALNDTTGRLIEQLAHAVDDHEARLSKRERSL